MKTCKPNVTDDTVLVTFDVCSLYTNISHEFGLRAIEYVVSNYRQSINPRFPTQFVLEAASFILSNNSMTFDEMFYLQRQGTEMGTLFALTYATLSMGFHEIELYAIIRNKFTLPVSNYFEENWKRFLDDGFIFLRLSLIKPSELPDVLNNINPAIQFTMETSDTQLPFLDVMMNKEGKKVFMDIYSKPTDSKRHVSFKSNHPKHCLKNIQFSLARRICMIAEKDSLKEIKLKELETILLEQHYPERVIKAGINKALKIPQNELRNVKEQEKKKILPFISTFNPNHPKVLPIIKQTLGNLKTSDRMRNALKKVKFINCKRQAPNSGRILCKSSLSLSNSISEVENCGKSFTCCQYIKEGIEHTFKTVDKKFEIRIPFNCESKNLIYIVICSGWEEEYIGQTQTMLKERLNNYRQHIRQPELQQIDVEGHIRTCGGGNFKIMPFFAIREDNKILGESYETYLMEKFKPALNKRHK